jgi:pimeloyl-ACP methyl ester carboxylesterase
LPDDYPRSERTLSVFPQRSVPSVLWYAREMRYALAPQAQPAPLVFVIAGTGASYESGTMRVLEAALHQAGYHVVSLSSPTHPNFLVSASQSGVPGDLASDSADLYRVMDRIREGLQDEVQVRGYAVAGYSLGGAQAAFVARLDEDLKVFGFRRALMINPPVSLYRSVLLLDELLERNLPSEDEFRRFYDRAMQRVSEIFLEAEEFDFNDDVLYRVYRLSERNPDELGAALQTLIALAFRISAANMSFTSDVLTGGGFFVPEGVTLGVTDSLTDYGKVALRTSFETYLRDYMLPFETARNPGTTLEALIARSGVDSIEGYLKGSPKVRMVTNADDIILAPGDLEYLTSVLGDRARVFPSGGHCGNLATPAFLHSVLRLLAE